jgi:hypothetical protein
VVLFAPVPLVGVEIEMKDCRTPWLAALYRILEGSAARWRGERWR